MLKHLFRNKRKAQFSAATGLAVCSFAVFFLYSFTTKQLAADFLQQLGITKATANEKIGSGFLGGAFDAYGIKNLKNIPATARVSLTKEIAAYSKQYVQTAAYLKEYNELRNNHKPEFKPLQTPEEMQQQFIAQYKKSVADMEQTVKTADATMKPIFEKMLADAKKQLKEAEDPNNKSLVNYRKNYEAAAQQNKAGYEQQIARWEQQYPSNHLLYVKKRLQTFLAETADVDFDAETIEKNGKKYFVNRAYESKGSHWKMAYRAGKDVVTTARTFVEAWLKEIN
ncbi:hypothetical protein ESA94_09030 [Lacibacter luteus]|uniref:Uncharacterized protein n=1 Tax=Lacibacter luteus TaxID=2508719 RepID=A0A4Q1CJN9_9BACT|nr:hypothetical protein [Lacibacter luteus]RXK60598.1 hypothetical protein ESA94_09030 [Lacibacter luteus]